MPALFLISAAVGFCWALRERSLSFAARCDELSRLH